MKVVKTLSSIRFTVVIFFLLILLIALMTLAQEKMGTYQAIHLYLDRWIIFGEFKGVLFPYFLGGKTLSLALCINLLAAYIYHFSFSLSKLGIHFIHIGTFILIAGMTLSAYFTQESQMDLREGSSKRYAQRLREYELVVKEVSDPNFDSVTAISEKLLNPGEIIQTKELPFTIRVTRYLSNAQLSWRKDPSDKLSNVGIGPFLEVRPMPVELKDDKENTRVCYLSLYMDQKNLGSWILSNSINEGQELTIDGKLYEMRLQRKRDYLPYEIKLISFTHERYEKSEIPKSFTSELEVLDENEKLIKKVTLSMNDPFRFMGRTFYQSGFGNGDQVSILHVVKNPIRSFPYICTAMIALGLFIQFFMRRKKS